MRRLIYVMYFIVLLGCGCSSSPPVKELIGEEIIQRNNAVGREIAQDFESRLKFKEDAEISIYLRGIAQHLLTSSQDSKDSGIGVWVIQNKNGKWMNFALPGVRVYLAVGMLKSLKFENELAAAIAIQIAHVLNRDIYRNLVKRPEDESDEEYLTALQSFILPTKVNYFGPSGIFAFGDNLEIAAIQKSVNLLYKAGYDARGMVTLFSHYENEMKFSPFDKDTIRSFIEAARREIALYSPLRNPTVSTRKFIEIQKRMRRL